MRAALIGLGMVSRTYGDAIRNSEKVALKSVYARSEASRAKFLSDWPDLGAVAAPSVEEIAADPEIDFVMLTTPPNARLEIVEVLARAGKPILMEKPVERTLADATRIVEICEAAGVPLGIMFQHRARECVVELRMQDYQMGETPFMVEVNVPWWRDQAYYDEPGRGSYARDGGGVLISQAIHTLDLMLSLLSPVTEVTAMAGTTAAHQMEAEDFVSAGLRFEDGTLGQLFATTSSFPGRGETITLHYPSASIHLEAGTLRIDRRDGTSEVIGEAAASGDGADPMAFTSDWHRWMIEDFAEALTQGIKPCAPGREALAVHRLIDALERAAKAGACVRL